jgi:hypothetical protein
MGTPEPRGSGVTVMQQVRFAVTDPIEEHVYHRIGVRAHDQAVDRILLPVKLRLMARIQFPIDLQLRADWERL